MSTIAPGYYRDVSNPGLNPDLVYVSERLAQALIQQAGREALLPIDNPYKLAATAATVAKAAGALGGLSDSTELVMEPLPMKAWIYRFKENSRRVAWLVGDLGTTLVVLCGSAANFLDHAPDEVASGWWPSSPLGMIQVVNSLRGEATGSASPLIKLNENQGRKAAETAAFISVGLSDDQAIDLRLCAVLFRKHAEANDITEGPPFTGRRSFERVVVGAPLMIQRLSAE